MGTEDLKFSKTWVTGDGGPIILMEKVLLPYWEGSNAPSNGRVVKAESRWGLDVATDYDLACDIDDWSGVINVVNGSAFVLGTSGDNMATWVPDFAPNGALVEWGYADREDELIEAARNFVDRAEFSSCVEFVVRSSPLVLFMAVESGDDPTYDRIEFEIEMGKYNVSSGLRETEKSLVICHSFDLQDGKL